MLNENDIGFGIYGPPLSSDFDKTPANTNTFLALLSGTLFSSAYVLLDQIKTTKISTNS